MKASTHWEVFAVLCGKFICMIGNFRVGILGFDHIVNRHPIFGFVNLTAGTLL